MYLRGGQRAFPSFTNTNSNNSKNKNKSNSNHNNNNSCPRCSRNCWAARMTKVPSPLEQYPKNKVSNNIRSMSRSRGMSTMRSMARNRNRRSRRNKASCMSMRNNYKTRDMPVTGRSFLSKIAARESPGKKPSEHGACNRLTQARRAASTSRVATSQNPWDQLQEFAWSVWVSPSQLLHCLAVILACASSAWRTSGKRRANARFVDHRLTLLSKVRSTMTSLTLLASPWAL